MEKEYLTYYRITEFHDDGTCRDNCYLNKAAAERFKKELIKNRCPFQSTVRTIEFITDKGE